MQVGDANALGQLTKQGITAKDDGFFYTYVTNQSAGKVNFDNMTIVHWAPVVRVVYDYYPYGLTWENPKLPSDPEGVHDHCYQDKEFQFAEFTTGHGLALYDFHARMYDPCTARWLVPDPAAQFANPYLAMGNNPVVSVDPDGQWINTAIGAVVGGFTNLAIQAVQGNVTDFKSGLIAFGMGALAGALAANGNLGALGGFNAGVIGAASSNIPGVSIPINDNLTVTASPAIAMGNGLGLGANVGLTYSEGNFSAGLSMGFTNYSSYFTGQSFTEGRFGGGFGFDNGKAGFSIYSTQFVGGGLNQRVAGIGISSGDFKMSIENDWLPTSEWTHIADNWDRYRTGAFSLIYKDLQSGNEFSAGVLMFTGSPGSKDAENSPRENGPGKNGKYYSSASAVDPNMRAGIAYVGFNQFSAGWNHDQIRHAVQNRAIHDILLRGESAWFQQNYMNYGFYSKIGATNSSYTLWD